ncbi:MAG: four helix bundle protein [Bacteroidales bacterium]|nr:four helix bundle protein [Bacteroidales bacterium]
MENDPKQNGTFFRFEDLRVYHKALDYIDWVYNTVGLFPENHSRELAKKFINSAHAIAFYIAEGSSRNKNQFIYYLKMAKSAVRECVVFTSVAEKQNLLTEVLVDESRNELMELTKMIGALIGSLQKPNPRYKGKNGGKHNDADEYSYEEFDDNYAPADLYGSKRY